MISYETFSNYFTLWKTFVLRKIQALFLTNRHKICQIICQNIKNEFANQTKHSTNVIAKTDEFIPKQRQTKTIYINVTVVAHVKFMTADASARNSHQIATTNKTCDIHL